jgi:hypothetical protein
MRKPNFDRIPASSTHLAASTRSAPLCSSTRFRCELQRRLRLSPFRPGPCSRRGRFLAADASEYWARIGHGIWRDRLQQARFATVEGTTDKALWWLARR